PRVRHSHGNWRKSTAGFDRVVLLDRRLWYHVLCRSKTEADHHHDDPNTSVGARLSAHGSIARLSGAHLAKLKRHRRRHKRWSSASGQRSPVGSIVIRPSGTAARVPSRSPAAHTRANVAGGFWLYQEPLLAMLVQGSAGGSAPPACSSSMETPSGVRMKAMRPSRGGRLIGTPRAMNALQVS